MEQIAQAGAAARAAWNALLLGLPQEARLILLGLAAMAAAILLGLVLRARARRRRHAEASVAPAERADPAARSSSAAASPAPAPTAAHPGIAEALRRIEACRLARADELDLGGLQLATLDEILAPLCGLTALNSLDLSDNGIGDEDARHLAGLTALTSLDLSDNGIGAEGARHLAGLTALTSLVLDFNGDLDLTTLMSMPRLRSLEIDECTVIAAPPALWEKPSLESVSHGIAPCPATCRPR